MHINLILIPSVIILGLLFGQQDTEKNRRWYIITCTTMLILVAALRSPEWMTYTYRIDTLNYQNYFENSFSMSWSELWQAIIGRYAGFNDDFDIGFVGLEKMVGLVTHDFHFYSFLVDLLFFIPFGLILYRYCTNTRQIIFAFVFYIALVQVYLLGGARQIFAMGFDMMALLAIADKKRILTIVFLLVGVSIHFSSILFIFPVLMVWLQTSPRTLKSIHALFFLAFPIVLSMPREIITFMGNASGLEKYAEYGEGAIQGGATTFIVLIETLSLFILFAIKRRDMEASYNIRFFYVMAPLFTIFAPLLIANGSMTRIALYYYLFLSLLVPFGIDCMFKKRERNLAYIVAIGALAFLTLSGGGMRYYFFWQV